MIIIMDNETVTAVRANTTRNDLLTILIIYYNI